MTNDFDAWMWKGEEMRLFRAGEVIPNDWYDAPDKFNGADPKALDLDGDGRAGGSLPYSAPIEAMAHESHVVFEPVATEETTIIPRKRGRPRKVKPDEL